MNRPYLRYSIAQLEELFPGIKSDEQMLKTLEEELKNRQVPRAQALLQEVREMLSAAKRGPSAVSQPELFSPTKTTEPLNAPARKKAMTFNPRQAAGWNADLRTEKKESLAASPPAQAAIDRSADTTSDAVTSNSESVSSMPLDTAYKLLKCGPTTPWEEIERVRQKLVAQSNPARMSGLLPEQKAKALAEAKQINQAYKAILAVRLQT